MLTYIIPRWNTLNCHLSIGNCILRTLRMQTEVFHVSECEFVR